MIEVVAGHRREWLPGVLLAIYATAIALTPSVPAKAILGAPLVIIPLVWWILNGFTRWLLAFFAAAWLLPPLPVAIGNSGPHVALLFAGMGALMGLLYLSAWRFQIDSIAAAMLALAGFLGLSLLPAAVYSGPFIAAASLARLFLFGISIYVFFYLRSGPSSDGIGITRMMFFTAAGSALFACIDFYYQFPAPAGYGAQFIWLDSGVFRRAQGFFYEASTLGNFCAFFLVMIVAALLKRRQLRILPVWSLLAGGVVLSAALVLSYSRGSLVNVFVAIAAALWLERRRIRMLRFAIGAGIILGVGGAVLFGVFRSFLFAYLTRLVLSAQFFFESPNGVLSGRVQSWQLLTEFLLAHPWHALLGIGFKTLPYSDFIGASAVADNTYLSMLIETGIGGLAALLALHATVITFAHRAARSSDARRSFFGTWIFCFWCGEIVQMLSGDLLTYWRVLPAYFCVLALAARE